MTKFDDFIKPAMNQNYNYQKLEGTYGCQLCDKNTDTAYFDERTLEMFWYCADKHRSSVQVG